MLLSMTGFRLRSITRRRQAGDQHESLTIWINVFMPFLAHLLLPWTVAPMAASEPLHASPHTTQS